MSIIGIRQYIYNMFRLERVRLRESSLILVLHAIKLLLVRSATASSTRRLSVSPSIETSLALMCCRWTRVFDFEVELNKCSQHQDSDEICDGRPYRLTFYMLGSEIKQSFIAPLAVSTPGLL